MKLIYEAQNSVEAHLIKDLLNQSHIEARVDGEYLQGGVGELQASGIVRVMINDEDHDLAIKIIRQWEAHLPSANEAPLEQYRPPYSGLVVGLILFVLAASLLSFIYAS